MFVSDGIDGNKYVNFLSLVIPVTAAALLYSADDIPVIRTVSSTVKE